MDIFVIKCTLISHKHLAATSRLHETLACITINKVLIFENIIFVKQIMVGF